MSPARKKLRANKSELHRATGLDRATITKRLNAAGVKPKVKKKKEEIFDANEALRALASDRTGITDARAKKLNVEAARVMLKLKKERGELLPLQEVRDELFKIMKAMHTRIVKRYPRENSRRLRRCRSDADLYRTMETDLSLIFDELKRDYPTLLSE